MVIRAVALHLERTARRANANLDARARTRWLHGCSICAGLNWRVGDGPCRCRAPTRTRPTPTQKVLPAARGVRLGCAWAYSATTITRHGSRAAILGAGAQLKVASFLNGRLIPYRGKLGCFCGLLFDVREMTLELIDTTRRQPNWCILPGCLVMGLNPAYELVALSAVSHFPVALRFPALRRVFSCHRCSCCRLTRGHGRGICAAARTERVPRPTERSPRRRSRMRRRRE